MEAQTRQKPLSATIVILLYVVEVASLITNALRDLGAAGISLNDLRASFHRAMSSPESATQVYIASMLLVVAVVDIVAVRGLYQLRPWAWRLAMTLQGVRLLLGLYAFFAGNGLSVSLFLPIIIVFLLNQREVRRVYKQLEANDATVSVIRPE